MIMVVSIAAAAGWLLVLRGMDVESRDKNGDAKLLVFFFAGVGSYLVSRTLYMALRPWAVLAVRSQAGTAFLYNLVFVGPVEECVKFATFLGLGTALRSIHERRDGLLQAAAVALGFAIAENVEYGALFGMPTLLWRSVLTTIGHMTLAAIWGSQWAHVVCGDFGGREGFRRSALAVAIAALDHGFYNAMLEINADFSFAADVVTVCFAGYVYYRFHESSPYREMSLWRYREAIPMLREALSRHPASLVLHARLGRFAMYAGRWDEALVHLGRCQRLRPGDPEIAFHRAIARLAAGRDEPGTVLLSRALTRLSRQEGRRLARSLAQLIPDRVLRDRLRDVVLACGGPEVRDVRSRPRPRPCRAGRPGITRAELVARRRLKGTARRLGTALREQRPPLDQLSKT